MLISEATSVAFSIFSTFAHSLICSADRARCKGPERGIGSLLPDVVDVGRPARMRRPLCTQRPISTTSGLPWSARSTACAASPSSL